MHDVTGITIGYDNAALAAQAVKLLASCGHEHIAVIHGLLAESDCTHARRSGASSASNERSAIDFYETTLNVAGGKRAVLDILQSECRFTAIL